MKPFSEKLIEVCEDLNLYVIILISFKRLAFLVGFGIMQIGVIRKI